MKTKYKCKDNDTIVKVFMVDDNIDELWIKTEGDVYWNVLGYDDLLEAIKKMKVKYLNKKGHETAN